MAGVGSGVVVIPVGSGGYGFGRWSLKGQSIVVRVLFCGQENRGVCWVWWGCCCDL